MACLENIFYCFLSAITYVFWGIVTPISFIIKPCTDRTNNSAYQLSATSNSVQNNNAITIIHANPSLS